MSFTVSYPGVYIQELPSDVRTIVGVPTSVTAFIGRTLRGPVNEPVRIFSFADFDRQFGGLWEASTVSFAVQQYFLNGGADAVVVRVHRPKVLGDLRGDTARMTVGGAFDVLAASPGEWGNQLTVTIDHETRDTADLDQFNILVEERDPRNPSTVLAEERFLNVSVNPLSPRFVKQVLSQESSFIRVEGATAGNRPGTVTAEPLVGGSNGDPIGFDEIANPNLEEPRHGLWALEDADIFNLLCIPPLEPEVDVTGATWDAALGFCKDHRAVLLVDPPANWSKLSSSVIATNASGLVTGERKNAAVFFPRIRAANPLKENRLETFAPCGAVAGVIARIDASRGVWKAPAGQEANLAGVRELDVKLTDNDNGLLNPQGINCLRSFPVAGRVVWGSRTLEGADQLASQWKYLPVRRLALYIEETLYRNTSWVVFEPNDEPLWSQIRLSIGSFMQNLFRQGAFQGASPRDAYLVKCDKDTTTQTDIDSGIVNIIVGFAPLKPAEFVIIKIRQLSGQVAA